MRFVLIPLADFLARLRDVKKADVLTIAKRAGVFFCVFGLLYLAALGYATSQANQGLSNLLKDEFNAASSRATNLIVVVHAYQQTSTNMLGVKSAIQEVRPQSDILMVSYPASTFSNGDFFEISERLCQRINEVWKTNQYEGVEFVGYSLGALLARKAYVYGWGRVEDINQDPDAALVQRLPQPWVVKTTRFVLLAGMNRGWTTRTRPNGMGSFTWFQYKVGKTFGIVTGTAKLIRQCEAGEPFVANLRMQWMDLHRFNKTNLPLMIQLLGDKDNLVTREDERDISVSKDFIWVQLSGTHHGNAADFVGEANNATSVLFANERKAKFQKALGNETAINALRRASPNVPSAEDTNVVTGVVVLHGIRDLGNEWTSQFEDALQARFMANHSHLEKLCIYRPTYGYFDMLSFLQPWERQSRVRWFMDELTELQAKYPNMTNLHFIGHSHGTYLLVSALKKYKSLKLQHAVFAGSVVPQNFNWASPGLTNRILRVRNYVGSSDLVVAWFPRIFELFNGDLGSAGFNGFRKPFDISVDTWGNFMSETRYVKGAHSAAIQAGDTNMIGSIADFVVESKSTEPVNTIETQTWWIKAGSHPVGSVTVWFLVILTLTLLGIYVTWFLRKIFPSIIWLGTVLRVRPFVANFAAWFIYFLCMWNLLKLV